MRHSGCGSAFHQEAIHVRVWDSARKMNKLHKDIRRLHCGRLAVIGALSGLAVLKLVQVLLGVEEREFYQRHPVAWWSAVVLGLLLVAAMVYCLIKTFAVNPNIQLRNRSDDKIQHVLDDPEYQLWHNEAQRQLDERHSPLVGKKQWYKTYAMVLLVVLLLFLVFAIQGINRNLKPKSTGIPHLAGFFLYMATGLYVFMSSGDKIASVRSYRFKIPLSVLRYSSFCVWLLGSMVWAAHMFDL
jgi:hypothetical protein